MTTRIDAALAAELENDERAIRIAEAIAHLLVRRSKSWTPKATSFG